MSKTRIYGGVNAEIALLNELIGDNPDDRGFGGFLRVGFTKYITYDVGLGMYIGNDASFNYSGLKYSTIKDTADKTRDFHSLAINDSSAAGAKFKLISLKNTFLDYEKLFAFPDMNDPLSISVNPDWKAVDVGFKVESKDYDTFDDLKKDYDAKLTNVADGNLGVLAIRAAAQDPRIKDKILQHREVLNFNSRPYFGYSIYAIKNSIGGGLGFFIDIGPTVGYALYENIMAYPIAKDATDATIDAAGNDAASDSTYIVTEATEKDPHALKDTDAKMKFKITGLTGGSIEQAIELNTSKLAARKAMKDGELEPYMEYLFLGGGISAGMHYDINSMVGLSMHFKYVLNSVFNMSSWKKIHIPFHDKLIGYKFLTEDYTNPTANVVSYVGNDLVKKIIQLQTGSKYMYDTTFNFAPLQQRNTITVSQADASGNSTQKTTAVITKFSFIKVTTNTLNVFTAQDTVGAFIDRFDDYYNKDHTLQIGDSSISLSQSTPYPITNWGFINPSVSTVHSNYPPTHNLANGRLYGNTYIVGSTPDHPTAETASKNMILYLYSSTNSFLPVAVSAAKKAEIARGFLNNVQSIIMKTVHDQAEKATPSGFKDFYIFPSQLPSESISSDTNSKNHLTLEHSISFSVGLSYVMH